MKSPYDLMMEARAAAVAHRLAILGALPTEAMADWLLEPIRALAALDPFTAPDLNCGFCGCEGPPVGVLEDLHRADCEWALSRDLVTAFDGAEVPL